MALRFDHPFYGPRLTFGFLFVSAWFLILFSRLWYLQCVHGAYFRDLSENNRTRTVRTLAPRGAIYDRENRVLVRNRPAFEVSLMREDIHDLDVTLREIARLTGRGEEGLRRQLSYARKRRPFEPQVVIADAAFEEIARLRAQAYHLPGVIIGISPTRSYPYSSRAAHLLGYTREITKSQLDELSSAPLRYRPGDVVGQAGLEKSFESLLRGQAGYVQVEVDAMGNRKSELGIVDSTQGNDLYLSIDLDLQAIAEAALAGRRGAVVAIDPNNGEVLALASSPTFDANVFSGEMLATEWQRITGDKEHPLRNRAISEVYPPGSTFKLIIAIAALAEGKISPTTVLHCPGYYMFGGRPYRCHKRSGHGAVDLKRAMAVSCNAFFYQVGQMLGVNTIHHYATHLGLGRTTGIEIPGENPGTIPSESWKLEKLGERWWAGETISVSIGQGYVSVTPLQMAVVASTIANSGKVYRPHLVRRVVHPTSGISREYPPELLRTVPIPPQVWATVRELAAEVVNAKHGTGTKAALPGIRVAGKTGTAQVAALGQQGKSDDHAWFVSFAPVENPMIATAVIIENGGHGGSAAAPVTRQVLEVFFRKRGMLPPLEKTDDAGTVEVSEDALTEGSDLPPYEQPALPDQPVPTDSTALPARQTEESGNLLNGDGANQKNRDRELRARG